MNKVIIKPTKEEALEALGEASISIACCLDEEESITTKDLEHIQDQITTLENYLNPYIKENDNDSNL
jgi:hypothetical protein